ncbi:MAG: polysaccharide biosynthesis protein [Acetatifactor sp.]|nr:polysaccharide biosynthesis protein [Acetatifactor sp.]
MKKNRVLYGTLILTLAGFLTRIMGFFYKIFLSNTLSEKNLGLYQLVFPVYGICFTLYASGIQTAASQMAANHPDKRRVLLSSILCSLTIAGFLSFLVYFKADFIAKTFLLEPACASSLRVLSFVFPFCGITACINGYYYGLKKTATPALGQLLEQIIRIIAVYGLAVLLGKGQLKVTCELAVFGVVLGEIAANFFSLASLFFFPPKKIQPASHLRSTQSILKQLLLLALPLTSTRLIINLLNSGESVLIPHMLKSYGLTATEALSLYGVLHGMALPFILFPTAITNALALLLLPTVSEAQASRQTSRIQSIGNLTVKYSLLIGLFSTCVFLLFGKSFGNIFFHNTAAGHLMMILAWLCPFLYLSTTLGSIINGLGQTHLTFINTIVGLTIRLAFLFFLVPRRGIHGYLTGLLISQLIIALLDFQAVHQSFTLSFHPVDCLLKPCIVLIFSGFFFYQGFTYFSSLTNCSTFVLLLATCLLFSATYFALLFVLGVVQREDFRL